MLSNLLAVAICLAPLLLLVALIVWLARRPQGPPQPPAPPPEVLLQSFDDQVARWETLGRLGADSAAALRSLIAEDRAALRAQGAAAVPTLSPAQAPPAPPPVVAAAAAPQDALTPAQPYAAPPTVRLPETLPPPPPPPLPATPGRGASIWAAVLALRTRQLLLYGGAFLLVMSALILVVFNWRNFSPDLQLALLAGVCGGMWGAGAWLRRQEGLEQAGVGLQAVGGVLVPAVAFGLARRLELEPRQGWLLASLLSAGVYALASWRLRHRLFVAAGSLSVGSAALAAASLVDIGWQPAALLAAMALLLPLARWLRGAAPALAPVPRWVAWVVAPLALLYLALLAALGPLATGAAPLALWLAAGFCALAAWEHGRPAWGWGAVALAPLALLATLDAAAVSVAWWPLAQALLACAALGAALLLEDRAPRYVAQPAVGSALAALLAGALIASSGSARWALGALLLWALAAALAGHRGRLRWTGAASQPLVAPAALALAGALLPAWALALLDLAPITIGQASLALLPLAGAYFAAARWWPGRLRPAYDMVLQSLGALLSTFALALAVSDERAWVAGTALFTAAWLLQALLRRVSWGAAVALGGAPLVAVAALARLDQAPAVDLIMGVALAFVVVYTLGGTLLRRTALGYWVWPALAWGALLAAPALGLVALGIDEAGRALPQHPGALLALAAVAAWLGWQWGRSWLGWLAAPLFAAAWIVAGAEGFFTGWRPEDPDFAYVLVALCALGVALGQLLRRARGGEAAPYAPPYEVVGYALLSAAPLFAATSDSHATLTWLALGALFGLAAPLYRQPWALAPALIALDMALLRGAGWLVPGGRDENAGLLLAAAAWAQASLGWALERRRTADNGQQMAGGGQAAPASKPTLGVRLPAFAIPNSAFAPAYAAAFVTGAGALAIAGGADDTLLIAALALAALAALFATLRRSEPLAWGALALLALGLAAGHRLLHLAPDWGLAWGVAEALAVGLIGWLVEVAGRKAKGESAPAGIAPPSNAPSATAAATLGGRLSAVAAWQRPLTFGPLGAAAVLVALLAEAATSGGALPPLTFALATLGLLLATLALRERRASYGYAAGGALVAAALCQLADWGFTQPQWYVVPAGLYLLAIGHGLRRAGRTAQARLVETGALATMLGTTFGQSLRGDDGTWALYAAVLCLESLAFVAYGTLAKLRVPFVGGIAFFVAGVLWLSLDPLQSANRWVLLGALGLLMVAAYVLLERRQEQLVRAGRAFAERVASWG
jgi:hypothetical protein